MPKRVAGNAFCELCFLDGFFQGLLDKAFVKMLPTFFSGRGHTRQQVCRKEPLPDQFPCAILIFFSSSPNMNAPE